MKRTFCLVLLFLSLSGRVSARETQEFSERDWELKLYFLPFSLNGIVAGDNPRFSRFEESPTPTGCNTLMAESRSYIGTVGNFNFSWSVGCIGYSEDYPGHEADMRHIIGISLGVGVYLNRWSRSSLAGPCLYLYPVYQLPVYVRGGTPYWHWKCAMDLGCTLNLGNITIYPFCRGIIAWRNWKPDVGFDAGVAIGLFFPDPYRNE